MTILSLNFPQSHNCKTMLIEDMSFFDDPNRAANGILEIKPPGQSKFVPFSVSPDFRKNLNCVSLNICCADTPASMAELPDGNYEIKYSYAPNLSKMVEFNHFRNSQQFRDYLQESCRLFKGRYSMTIHDFNKRLEEIYKLKELINAAKYAAEECLDVADALDKYDEASKKIMILANGQKCSTC